MVAASVAIVTSREGQGFAALAESLDERMAMVIYRFSINVQKRARLKAPVRTGALKNSIRAKKIRVGMWEIKVGVHYGIYVEYGTRHMAPQPYFRPAIEAARRQMRQDFKAVFKTGNQLRLT